MNNSLDDLMAVWRSQDAVPLHGVNETLLRLALRQDEAKLKRQRRIDQWGIYIGSATFVGVMAVFLYIMTYNRLPKTGWDFALLIIGAALVLSWARAMHVRYRAQAQREQRYGETLRDQLGRHITQLDYQATNATGMANVLTRHLPVFFIMIIIFAANWRGNNMSLSENGKDALVLVGIMVVFICSSAVDVWKQHRATEKDVLPRKRRLEAMLKELDGQ